MSLPVNQTWPPVETQGTLSGLFRTSCTKSQDQAYEIVLLTLTTPLWTFLTAYLLLMLIYCLRRIQYFKLYDRCSTKDAHFRYDFHIVAGRQTSNYSQMDSHLIVDLLDNQLISTMTIQVPGSTIFNGEQVFTYNHSRSNLRNVIFSIYRRHPIKDVRCVRVAHSCNNTDSRLFIYGVNLYDSTNSENKFFPITSVVKYRGTQWALNTTFEPRNGLDFAKLGCDNYDPFGTSIWPNHMEKIYFIFYIWCAVLCFGHLIPVDAVWESIALHILTVTFIVGTSAVFIGFVYLRLVKIHVTDQHYSSVFWQFLKVVVISLVLLLSLSFWVLSTGQFKACKKQSLDWMISSLTSATLLTLTFSIAHFLIGRRKISNDNALLNESDNTLLKTNSRQNFEFVKENSFDQKPQQQPPPTVATKKTGSQRSGKTSGSTGSTTMKTGKKNSHSGRKSGSKPKVELKATEDTLDNVFANSEGVYMKTRNRNSISQYV